MPDHPVADRLAESGTQFTNLPSARQAALTTALATVQVAQAVPDRETSA